MTEDLTDRDRDVLDDSEAIVLLTAFEQPKRDRPPCDHCWRAARYLVALGRDPDPDTPGYLSHHSCDACLERVYEPLEADLVDATGLFDAPDPPERWGDVSR